MIDLEALEALCAKASPGPWEAYGACCCPDQGGVDGPRGTVCPAVKGPYGHPLAIADAEFVAAVREALPSLCAEVRRLRDGLTQIERLAALQIHSDLALAIRGLCQRLRSEDR